MATRFVSTLRTLVLAAGAALPTMALSQPLAVTVNPLAAPIAILTAPFTIFDPPESDTYNPFPASEAAAGYAADGRAIVATPVLYATGPQYENPAGARRAVVLRRGSTVPGYVPTAPARNVSVRGLVPGAEYEFFVSPQQKIVFLDGASRRIVRIVR